MNQNYFYDKKTDSLYIHLKDGPEERFEEAAPGVHIEYNRSQEMIGIEILKASRFLERTKDPLHK